MIGNSKFDPLTQYLLKQRSNQLVLTFSEIEKILHFKLCASARKHMAYWHISDTHILPQSIEKSGYSITHIDIAKEIIELKK